MNLKSKYSVERSAMLVAKIWAESRSKDPSTKVGAVIIDPLTGGLFAGYNGFPAVVNDDDQVWGRRKLPKFADGKEMPFILTKYDVVVHAEVNACRKALMGGVDLSAATLVVTHLPCPQCMKDVVLTNGIMRVVYESAVYNSQDVRTKWVTLRLAQAGGVVLECLSAEGEPEPCTCPAPNVHSHECPRHGLEIA